MKIKASISLDEPNNNDDVEKIIREKSKNIDDFIKGFAKKVNADWYCFFGTAKVDSKHSSPISIYGSKEKEQPMLTLAKLKMCEQFIFKEEETTGIDDIKEAIKDKFGVKNFILVLNIDGNVAAIRSGNRFAQILALTEAQVTLTIEEMTKDFASEVVKELMKESK
jgi:hypothetical protein